MSEKLKKDAANDSSKGRLQLASNLNKASVSLLETKAAIDRAWKISKPYMNLG